MPSNALSPDVVAQLEVLRRSVNTSNTTVFDLLPYERFEGCCTPPRTRTKYTMDLPSSSDFNVHPRYPSLLRQICGYCSNFIVLVLSDLLANISIYELPSSTLGAFSKLPFRTKWSGGCSVKPLPDASPTSFFNCQLVKLLIRTYASICLIHAQPATSGFGYLPSPPAALLVPAGGLPASSIDI